jgi:hypothetical protein
MLKGASLLPNPFLLKTPNQKIFTILVVSAWKERKVWLRQKEVKYLFCS